MSNERTAAVARIFVAIGMAAFGVHQLVHGSFARWVAKLPPQFPAPAIWPYLTGAVFIACAAAILFRKQAIAILLHPFAIARNPGVADLWRRAGKVFALSGAAALAAGIAAERADRAGSSMAGEDHSPLTFLPGRLLLHQQMIPAWIPGRVF